MSSGLFSQLGAAAETTWATRVAADHFIEFRSESMVRNQRFFQSMQLGASTTFPRGSRFVPVTQDATGDFAFEVPNKGYGVYLNALHSASVSPVQQGATIAYKQTHPIGLTTPSRSLTLQAGRPSTDGTVRPFEYPGSMVTAINWSWAVDDALINTISFTAQKEDTSQTLATRSLPSALSSFVFTQGAMTVNGSLVAYVQDGNISLSFPRNEFYGLDATGLKQKPIQNAMVTGTGAATFRFVDMTQYNLFVNNTKPALILDFVGAQIASPYNFEMKITLNMVGFTGATPTVAGPDVLQFSAPFNILYDGTNAPVIVDYTSTDTTL
jgi:hypothetical protein